MTEARLARTDPHSHHELPPERPGRWAPSVRLQAPDGTLTPIGAALYACIALRGRWGRQAHGSRLHLDYVDAAQNLGALVFWTWSMSEGWA